MLRLLALLASLAVPHSVATACDYTTTGGSRLSECSGDECRWNGENAQYRVTWSDGKTTVCMRYMTGDRAYVVGVTCADGTDTEFFGGMSPKGERFIVWAHDVWFNTCRAGN